LAALIQATGLENQKPEWVSIVRVRGSKPK